MKKILLILILSFINVIYATEFDIKKFSDPNKYGWDTPKTHSMARQNLYNRQKLLQIYELNKQDIIKNIIKSAVAPGWGHYTAKKYTRGHFLLATEIILFGTSYFFYDQAMEKYDKYKKSTYIGDINQYYLDAKDPYVYSQIFFSLGVAVWLYTIYDSISATDEYNHILWNELYMEYHQKGFKITPLGISLRF